MTDGLTDKDRSGIRAVLKATPKVRRAVLFGSRAMGTFRGASDVDLALEGDDIRLADLVTLKARIAKLNLPVEVDLVARAEIDNPELEKHIKAHGREWYRTENRGGEGMAGEWAVKSVAELQAAGALLVEDGNHGENRPRPDEFSSEGIQFIRAADMDSGRVLFESAQRINEVARQRVRKGIGAGGDVLLSHKGTVGKVAYVPLDAPPFVCSPQTTFWRVKDPRRLDRRYIYFFLLSRAFREQLDSRKGETDMADYVSLTSQRTLKVTVPPLAEQKAIAAVLGALDDKIELNRRMNATLEAMARALFQSWFVDFDPVRAKLDGRKPDGLDNAAAALFPAAFQDSPLGPIPRGWEVGRLDDVLTLQRGFDLPTSDRTHGVYPVMAASGPNGCHDKFMVHGPGVTTGRSGVLGKVFFIHGDFWPLNTSLWVKEFKRVSPAYAFHLLRGLDFEIFNAGSAVPTLNRNHVHNLPVLMPPKPIVDALDGQVMPLMKQQQANEDQSRTLATLRDTLLPKLLSGELRIRN